jgi:hypothetical protein
MRHVGRSLLSFVGFFAASLLHLVTTCVVSVALGVSVCPALIVMLVLGPPVTAASLVVNRDVRWSVALLRWIGDIFRPWLGWVLRVGALMRWTDGLMRRRL